MSTIPAGSLIFAKSGAACFIKSAAGVTLAAPTGVTLPNGTSSLLGIAQCEDGSFAIVDNAGQDLNLYNMNLAVRTVVAGSFGPPIRDGGSGEFLVYSASGVFKYSSNGTLLNSYTALTGTSAPNLAWSSPNGAVAYSYRSIAGTPWLTRLTLSGTGTRTDLTDISAYGTPLGSGQGMSNRYSNGDVLIAMQNGTAWAVERFNSSGVHQQSYSIVTGSGKYISAILACHDGTGFWASYKDGSNQVLVKVKYTDGSTLATFNIAPIDDSNFAEFQYDVQDTTTCLPAGTLMLSGYGESGTARYFSPSGTMFGQPASAIQLGGAMGGMCRLSGNNIAVVGAGDPNFHDTSAGTINGSDLTPASEITSPFAYIGGFLSCADASNHVYTASGNTAGILKVGQFGPLGGAALATWDLTYSSTLYEKPFWAMGISPDGLTLYAWMRGQFSQPDAGKFYIHQWSLVGAGSYVGKFDATNYTTNAPGENSLFCMPNGDLIALFRVLNGVDGAAKQYTSAGSIIRTLTGTHGSSFHNAYTGGPDEDSTGFWYWAYEDVPTSSSARYYHINASTGAELHSFVPEDGDFQFDCPMSVLGLDVGICIISPTTPPSILVNSDPSCVRSSNPATNIPGPVLSPIGPDWVSSCVGGGVPPVAADLVAAEAWDLT